MEPGLELISYKLCPFVQRAAITLEHKGVAFDVQHIDLGEPPAWFGEISPLGKVPVLKHGDAILFESAVINEYIDDITGGDLQSRDPLQKAKDRAWIEFASEMLGSDYMMMVASDQVSFDKYRGALIGHLERLETSMSDGPWFNGERFSLVDTAFAPLFTHLEILPEGAAVVDAKTMPKVHGWSRRLLELPEVQASVVPDFRVLYAEELERNNSVVLQYF